MKGTHTFKCDQHFELLVRFKRKFETKWPFSQITKTERTNKVDTNCPAVVTTDVLLKTRFDSNEKLNKGTAK